MNDGKEVLVQAARDLLRTQGYFVDRLWHAKDVEMVCDDLGLPCPNSDDVQGIFSLAADTFDGEYGICWPQLERAARTYFGEAAVGRFKTRRRVKIEE